MQLPTLPDFERRVGDEYDENLWDLRYLIPHAWCGNADGSDQWPWIVKARPETPERHFGGFDITEVPDIKHGNFEYCGYHIRVATPVPDRKKWKCAAPPGLPGYLQGRVLEVQGPAAQFWHKKKLYHDQIGRPQQKSSNSKLFECAATEKAHATAEMSRKDDVNRQKCKIWIVFQVGIILNPVVFSASDTKISAEYAPGYMSVMHPLNSTGKEQRAMNVCWQLAIEGNEQQVDEESDDDDAAYW